MKMKRKEYDEMFTSKSFAIVIRCKHCHSIDCFIGIKDLDESSSSVDTALLNLLRGDGTNIDIVCNNCGYIENCY